LIEGKGGFVKEKEVHGKEVLLGKGGFLRAWRFD